jgi:hypothetical protein
VADPESFHWVGIQYRNSAPQYATVLTIMPRYLGRRESGVVLGLPKTWLGPPLGTVEPKCSLHGKRSVLVHSWAYTAGLKP